MLKKITGNFSLEAIDVWGHFPVVTAPLLTSTNSMTLSPSEAVTQSTPAPPRLRTPEALLPIFIANFV
jgi:hypothetical protein